MKRFLSSCIGVTLVVATPAAFAAAAPGGGAGAPSPLSLEWCLARAAAQNPALAAAADAADAARHRIGPAGAFDDPRVRYDVLGVPTGEFNLHSTAMSGQQLGLMQKLPFPGLLGSREAAARASANAAAARFDDRRRRVAAAVERAWAELGFAQRALGITDRNLVLLRQLAKIAEARYRVGTGLEHDVLRAQVEVTVLLEARLRRRAALQRAEADLAALLDLPPDVRFPETAALDETTPAPALPVLLAALDRTSPRLAALRARIAEARKQRRATVLEGYPDVDLGVGVRFRQHAPGDPVAGQDFLSAGITVRFPVDRGKWHERVAERDALVRRAKAELRGERAALRDAARTAYAELERAASEETLLETGLVPQARQSFTSSRAAYRVGRLDFESLIASQVRLLDAELRLVRSRADRRTAFASLEATLGETLR